MSSSPLGLTEITNLLDGADDSWLFKGAESICSHVFGGEVFLRAIVEFSSHCRKNCLYCGLRNSNKQLSRYCLSPARILECVQSAAAENIGTVVLQSGEDSILTPQEFACLIVQIKKETNMAVTLSLGEQPEDDLFLWKEAGADRYLLKMETFDRELYGRLRPGCEFEKRLHSLTVLRKLGYEVGSGIISGLPGQSKEGLARDLLELTSLELDMISVGPFIPHPDTPLAGSAAGNTLEAMRAMAILRLLNPEANIPATSALEILDPGARSLSLSRGGNVIMSSVTPDDVGAGYNIYPGKNAVALEVREKLHAIKSDITLSGKFFSGNRGFSKRKD